MRDRLIEIMQEWGNENTDSFPFKSVADFLLKNGVIVPPCKVGDKLYIVADISKKIIEATIIGVWIFFDNKTYSVITDFGTIHTNSIGVTVFLTREEAKQALKGGVE